MTDKQIIIDGVPVQDCCYFDYENDGYEDSCYIHQNECSAQNCYYKQLKRKEQECEELKAERDSWHYQWEKRYEIGECLSDKIDQLKQTLTEIKEIADKIANYYDGDEYELMRKDAEQILQKISECEE